MPNYVTPEVFGNFVDQLVTLEARVPAMPQNVLKPLYEAARAACGGSPVTMAGAEGLVKNLKKGDTVFVMTGAAVKPTLPFGESDGPPGRCRVGPDTPQGIGSRAGIRHGRGTAHTDRCIEQGGRTQR